ncbi:MAG: hypothetical protein RM049_11220 [Nostoc sp. DedQUE04]|uniref:hypothetical protein n=1 Tax=Nostoc sp. DedQUE04 TaxID=3075390 RepID=UPI002AD3DA76|nr:hypothetical protein [Nostoc sp. DedQUE04]MDZ8135855.1 hypothetical protein [Nostoc sp. DedQUE04]
MKFKIRTKRDSLVALCALDAGIVVNSSPLSPLRNYSALFYTTYGLSVSSEILIFV